MKGKVSLMQNAITSTVISKIENTEVILQEANKDLDTTKKRKQMPEIPPIDESIAYHFEFFDSQIKLLEEPE